MSKLEQNNPNEVWRKGVLGHIADMSDEKALRHRWSGKNPKAIGCFTEDIAILFDDLRIDEFVSQGAKAGNLTSEQYKKLQDFYCKIDAFIHKFDRPTRWNLSEEKVLSDPEWGKVIAAAKSFVDLLDPTDLTG